MAQPQEARLATMSLNADYLGVGGETAGGRVCTAVGPEGPGSSRGVRLPAQHKPICWLFIGLGLAAGILRFRPAAFFKVWEVPA